MKLTKQFYMADAIELAPKLLGKLICRNINGNITKARITETESYWGEDDTACHAHKGRTRRTEVLYMEGGTSYVYLCYGIHYLFNVVAGEIGHPGGVLIRGTEGVSGPGKLTKILGIDISLNGLDLCTSDKIWLEDDGTFLDFKTARRVGIDYATDEYKYKPWRFIAK